VPIGRYPNGHSKCKRHALPTQKVVRGRLRGVPNELARGQRLDEKALTFAAYLAYWLDDVIQQSALQAKPRQGHTGVASLLALPRIA